MNSWVYTEKVKDHFTNPKNILEDEEAFGADGRGEVGNIACGDQMLVVIKVKDNIITECKWKTYGCASAIASTSMMSEMVVGMTIQEAYKIKPDDIVGELGGLPGHKIHCSVLGDRALRAAIEDYCKKNGLEDKLEKEKAIVICVCNNITDQDIEEFIKNGGQSFEEFQEKTKIATVCGGCREKAMDVFEGYMHLFGGH